MKAKTSVQMEIKQLLKKLEGKEFTDDYGIATTVSKVSNYKFSSAATLNAKPDITLRTVSFDVASRIIKTERGIDNIGFSRHSEHNDSGKLHYLLQMEYRIDKQEQKIAFTKDFTKEEDTVIGNVKFNGSYVVTTNTRGNVSVENFDTDGNLMATAILNKDNLTLVLDNETIISKIGSVLEMLLGEAVADEIGRCYS